VRAPPAAIDVRWNAGDAALAQHRLADLGLLRSEYSRFATLGFIDAENLSDNRDHVRNRARP